MVFDNCFIRRNTIQRYFRHLEVEESETFTTPLLHLAAIEASAVRLHSDQVVPPHIHLDLFHPLPYQVLLPHQMVVNYGEGRERCTECLQPQESLSFHFNYSSSLQSCTRCLVPLSSDCALRAHVRLHERLPPHTCPECGLVWHTWAALASHLSSTCPHSVRTRLFTCPACPPSSAAAGRTRSEVVDHLAEQHVRRYSKCPRCPKAFPSDILLRSHAHAKHGISTSEAVTPMLLYKFRRANGAFLFFQSFEALREQLEKDARVPEGIWFICPECDASFQEGSSHLSPIQS